MGKSFRLSTNLPPVKHWEKIQGRYGSNQIDSIEDPQAGQITGVVTSIPSPFAAFEMVRAAFAKLGVNGMPLAGSTMYHRLVSHALDIIELVFNHSAYGDQLEFIPWHPENSFNNLQRGGQKVLSDTLRLYWNQDAESFNFHNVKNIWIIKYNYQVIGSTSPVTLFMATSNEVSFSFKLSGNNEPLSKSQFVPLFGRDSEFVEYLYALRDEYNITQNGQFSTHFAAFDSYLTQTLIHLQSTNNLLWSKIMSNSQQRSYYSQQYTSQVNGLEVLGFPILNRHPIVNVKSDFAILSTKWTSNKPLVLAEGFPLSLNYTGTTSKWNPSISVPAHDSLPLDARLLPGTAIKYPYLTVHDFLQPYLFRLPFKTNDIQFKVLKGRKQDYLLPLTELFFEFFEPQELDVAQKPSLSIKEEADSVEVILSIPISNVANRIELKRTYQLNSQPSADYRKGGMMEVPMSLAVAPLLDTGEDKSSFYRAALVCKSTDYPLRINFATNDAKIIQSPNDLIRVDAAAPVEFKMLENKRFGLLEISLEGLKVAKAFVIPIFRPVSETGGVQFTFAVDFGTTNTHIEYVTNLQPNPQAFDIGDNDTQIAYLHAKGTNFSGMSLLEIPNSFGWTFLPEKLGVDKYYRLPQRTVIARPISTHKTQLRPLGNCSIPFAYGREVTLALPIHSVIESDLKWNSNQDTQAEMFLEELVFMLRNKVLLNSGTLAATSLRWSYPTSMSIYQQGQLEDFWKNRWSKYFGNPQIRSCTESIAPFYYLQRFEHLMGKVLSVDIGGGTTDVVYFDNSKPTHSTSFRFAASALFGDGFAGNPNNNGFVLRYRQKIKKAFEDLKLNTAFIMTDKAKSSSEILNILFAIENSEELTQRDPNKTTFISEAIKKDELRYVVILHITALLYHLAQFLKANQLDAPRYISFSGNGSLILKLIGSDSIIQRIVREIFTKCGFQDTSYNFEIKHQDNPKLLTAKGILFANATEVPINNLIGIDTDLITGITYQDIVSKQKEDVVLAISTFANFFDQFIRKVGRDWLGLDNPVILALIKEEFSKTNDLSNFLEMGIDKNRPDEEIKETLFFYPLLGMINRIAYRIVNETNP
jgi:hypothetical protein